jgi:hypothetical protein
MVMALLGSPAVERTAGDFSGCGCRSHGDDTSLLMRLEAENWKIALERYDGHPIPALLLAHQLMAIRQCLERGKKGISDAVDGLDLAIDALYPHTDFHKVSHKLYLRRLQGVLKPEQEEKLRLLGIKV